MCSVPPIAVLDGGRLAGADDLCQDVRLAQDQELVALDLHFGSAVLREDDRVAGDDLERDNVAAVVLAAGTDGKDGAALRLFLGRVRQDDAAGGHVLLVEDLDDETITKRLEIHGQTPSCSCFTGIIVLALSGGECQRSVATVLCDCKRG